jgi:hypothetical protein
MVDTTQPTEQTDKPPMGSSRRTWLIVVAVVVVALAMLIVVVAISSDTSNSTMPDEVNAIIDDYNAAQVNGDAQAWLGTITDDFFQRRYIYESTGQGLIDSFVMVEDDTSEQLRRINYYTSIEYRQIGDPAGNGNGPWFVSIPQVWTEIPDDTSVGLRFEGISTYTVVERDSVVAVASYIFTGTVEAGDKD